MANLFRLLKANEIDVRIGQTGSGYVTLLLYKDARCDQNILDEAVGPMNWQREHSRDNANCTVSLWDKEKGQWISKEDTGTESNTEKEKGLASDSFKRACVNWGIGRELYTAPRIYIRGNVEQLKKEKFAVAEIGYDSNREINKLAIANKSGAICFRFGNVTVNQMPIPVEEPPEDAATSSPAWDISTAIQRYCERKGITGQAFNNMKMALCAGGVIQQVKYEVMGPLDFDNLCKAMEMNYGDQMRAAS